MTDLILLATFASLVLLTRAAWNTRSKLGVLVLGLASAGAGYWLVTRGSVLIAVLVVVFAAVAGGWAWHRRTTTAGVVTRWGDRSRRKKGVASTWDVIRTASSIAMRRRSAIVRPSLPPVPWKSARTVVQPQVWRTWFGTPVTEFALRLVGVGLLRIHASYEDVVTIVGGPRKGKTAMLSTLVLDAPGALVTTSTRLDVMEQTEDVRRARGPVYVFNPNGLGDVPSTIAFDPLTGCTDAVTAGRRAEDMVPDRGDAKDSWWDGQGRRALAAMMHAAALGDLTMQDVGRWVANPKNAERQVLSLLRKSPEAAFVTDFGQFLSTAGETSSSITLSISPALRWLNVPSAVEATKAGVPFDVEQLLREHGTVYLLGEEEGTTAPLLAALAGYIAREARRLAAQKHNGLSRNRRLDPPLSVHLDEAHRVAPVPLPLWTGDMGGAGIQITLCVQSRSDLASRWGEDGAAKILNNSAVVVLFGGTKGANDLDAWSRLAGNRDEEVVTRGKDGKVTSRSVRQVPVLSTTQIAGLPKHRVVTFVDGMPPAIGWTPRVWKRADVKAAAKARAALPVDVAPAAPVPPAVRERVADHIPTTSHSSPVPLPAGELVTNGHRAGGSR